MRKVVGFTAGTFDMFHIGHLNLIKNAKARCDYLIVDVNTDALVASYKGKKVIVPLDERTQIVSALKYVDEVEVADTLDKVEMRKRKNLMWCLLEMTGKAQNVRLKQKQCCVKLSLIHI